MGFLKRLLGHEQTPIKPLSANIVTDEDHKYFVSFSKHHPQLQLPEFVRLVLHYYAKILFNFDPSDPESSQSALILKTMVDSVISEGIRKDSDIFQVANIDDVATMVSSSPRNVPRRIVATLLSASTAERQINTDIPRNIYNQQVVFSVMALLQAALREMDQDCIDVLNRALANMNAAYDSGQSYSDFLNLATLPNSAYLSAIMGDLYESVTGHEELYQKCFEEILDKIDVETFTNQTQGKPHDKSRIKSDYEAVERIVTDAQEKAGLLPVPLQVMLEQYF